LFVLVTGGTGQVGCYEVVALAKPRCQIRVLARSAQGIPAALGPLGVRGVVIALGDVTRVAASPSPVPAEEPSADLLRGFG